jgi:hypothetical protein
MDDQKQEDFRLLKRLITRDITEMMELVSEPDKVQTSLIVVHLMDLECAMDKILDMLKDTSETKTLDTRSSRWE